jgi:hypothetical protein
MTGKRLFLVLGVLLIVLVGAVALFFAALDPQAATTSAMAPLTPTPTGVVSAQVSHVRRVTGTIQALGNQSFVVVLPHGNTTITIRVDALTSYRTASSAASFTNLKVGQKIYVSGKLDQHDPAQILAASVVILS